MGVCNVRLPGQVGVSQNRPDELFIHLGYILLGVAKGGVGQSSQDVQVGFSLCVDIPHVLRKCQAPVVRYAQCGGGVGVGNCVQGNRGL